MPNPAFQRYMEEVLDGLDYCFVYVDDVLIGSKSLVPGGVRASLAGGSEQDG